jgi:hypothetical protein
MNIVFHPEAEAEFTDAIEYYENCEYGLGLDFAREIQATIRNVADYPAMWPKIEDQVRRCLVHRFPYGLLYCVEPGGVFLLAVMNLHRDPDYWKHRIK